MTGSIFISGGTGFLGTELCARLLDICDSPIHVLVRAADQAEALHRLREAWQHDGALYASIGTRAFPVVGDFTQPGLGLDAEAADRLRRQASHVFHVGAEVGFQKGEAELMAVNREGTRNMLAFAGTLEGLQRFVYVSTAYVAGQRSGVIREDDPVGTAFSSLYERSKAEAEGLVRAFELPFVICRPGMIVGDSRTGRAKNFNTVYYVMKRMLLGRLRVLPVKRDQRLNVVPVNYVAEAVAKLGFSEASEGRTFHLTCPTAMQPRAGELTDYVRAWAAKNLGVRLPRPAFLPLNAVKRLGLIHNEKPGEKRRTPLSNMLTLAPYFFSDQDFDRTNTDAVCGPYALDWRDAIDALLTFACQANFMRQTGQTVFEQAMTRRASARHPIHYYDVTSDGLRRVSGREVNERVATIANALRSWGIHKGDRVALTGINSVDYLALEQAVGLVGATSVPIYYTTPIPEAELLLTKSGAKWFFVGDRRIMAHIEEMKADVRCVAFSAAREIMKPNVMTWEAFMAGGATPAPVEYPAPEDLATIRYTSGTTGEPKGVMFNFKQLTWMGRVLTGLLTWEDRNRPLRYLSFLPLSHVVEGISRLYG